MRRDDDDERGTPRMEVVREVSRRNLPTSLCATSAVACSRQPGIKCSWRENRKIPVDLPITSWHFAHHPSTLSLHNKPRPRLARVARSGHRGSACRKSFDTPPHPATLRKGTMLATAASPSTALLLLNLPTGPASPRPGAASPRCVGSRCSTSHCASARPSWRPSRGVSPRRLNGAFSLDLRRRVVARISAGVALALVPFFLLHNKTVCWRLASQASRYRRSWHEQTGPGGNSAGGALHAAPRHRGSRGCDRPKSLMRL